MYNTEEKLINEDREEEFIAKKDKLSTNHSRSYNIKYSKR
jgi:hypothetical protein